MKLFCCRARWHDVSRIQPERLLIARGGNVKHLRIVVVTALLLLPAGRLWAQAYDAAGPRELYHAEVCNTGRIAVDVAVAYRDFGFTHEFWMVDYWYRAAPGNCKL